MQKTFDNSTLGHNSNGSRKRFTVISLFSGGMGLDIGLEQTGKFRLLAAVEKVPAFCETILKNRDAGRIGARELCVYPLDIDHLKPKQMMKDLGLDRGELDLLVGGPPCQAFSTAGGRASVQDPRGTLLWRFLDFIEVLQPKFFLMENVRGLMSAALRHRQIADRPEKGGAPLKPDEQPGSVIRKFVADLHGAYRLDCFEINAVNYGVPQLRERALFIGNRLGRLVEFPEPTHGVEEHAPDLFSFSKPLLPFRTLRQALEGLNEREPVIMDFSPRKKSFLEMIPPGGNWRCLPTEIAEKSMGSAFFAKGGRSGWWRRLTWDLPSPTIVTMPNHAGTALCHPTETRALSLRECARVQEFPDDWEFSGTTSEQYAQVGNAVPIRLGRVAGEVLIAELADARRSPAKVRGSDPLPPCRIVYLKSHIRTRQWFKAGQEFVWRDGDDRENPHYGPAKTHRKVKTLRRSVPR